MILKISADGGIVEQRCDAGGGQRRSRPNPRQLQKLRRVDRASANDHFAGGGGETFSAVAGIFDPDGAASLEANPAHPGARLEAQVSAAQRRAQKCIGRRTPQTIADRHLIAAQSFGMRSVEILGPIEAQLRGRLAPVAAHRMQKRRHVLDVQRPFAQGRPAGSTRRSDRSKYGRTSSQPQPGLPMLPPIIEILRHAAAVDQRIDGARSADHPPARPVDAAAIEARIRERLVFPIDRGVGKGAAVADGRLDPKAPIRAAGFEHQYPVAATGRQAIGKDAARGARADDDVVKVIHVRSLVFRPCGAMPFRDSPMSFFAAAGPSRNGGEPCMVRRTQTQQGCLFEHHCN